jgi:hypothetical protein
MSFFSQLSQNVTESPGNSSVANLNAGATFTGTKQSTLGVAGIQINLKTDQNCTIYVDQSMDDVPNWDITDAFNYYASKGGTGFTVQATGKNVRVRVTNLNATTATTYFRLALVLCPIVESLPRALSAEGNLKVGVYEIEGDFDTRVEVTPMNALKVAQDTRLVGSAFSAGFDTNFWMLTTATGTSTATVAARVLTLATNPTGVGSGNSVIVNSVRTARYSGGQPNYYRGVVRCPAVTGANTRRWGAFNANDGYFFEHDGTTMKVNTRKATVDGSAVASGSFNGTLGSTYTLDANVNTFEIHWTNRSAWFFINGVLLHKLSATTATLTATNHLQIGMECTNGANTNNNTLEIWTSTILREGPLLNLPQSYRIAANATATLKAGPGNLHRVIVGTLNTTAGTLTLYDNTAGTGTVISVVSTQKVTQGNLVPISLDFGGMPFNTGLTIVHAGGAADYTVIYE